MLESADGLSVSFTRQCCGIGSDGGGGGAAGTPAGGGGTGGGLKMPAGTTSAPKTVACGVESVFRLSHGVDALIHCAFIISGGERSPAFRAVNVEGSKNVFRAAASAGVKTVSFVSSVSAYGCVPGHPVPIVESTPRVPM